MKNITNTKLKVRDDDIIDIYAYNRVISGGNDTPPSSPKEEDGESAIKKKRK
jgi:hypothetical protein